MTKRNREGFTLIEIIMALGIMTVGAVGIMSLQQAATRGNMESRELGVASQVTRSWLERLRRDAVRWNQQGANVATRATTEYLQTVDGNWYALARDPVDNNESYGFDYQGQDTTTVAQMVYCAHVRLSWVVPGDTIRADVRTFWHRRAGGRDNTQGDRRLFGNCGQGAEAAVTAELAAPTSRLRAVHASTLIRWQPLQ